MLGECREERGEEGFGEERNLQNPQTLSLRVAMPPSTAFSSFFSTTDRPIFGQEEIPSVVGDEEMRR